MYLKDKMLSQLATTFRPRMGAIAVGLALSSSAAMAIEEAGLEQALQAAMQHDPELRVAYMTFQADKEEVLLAKGNLLPSITFSASHRYEDSDNVYTDPDNAGYYNDDLARSTGKLNDSTWQVSLRQPLFDLGRYYEYKSVQSFVDGADYRYQRAEQDLTYRLAERYLAVLLGAQQVFLNKEKLAALEANLVQVEREFALGVGDQLNVLEVKARRDLARSDLLQAQSHLSDAETLLENMTGERYTVPADWVENGHKVEYNPPLGSESEWLEKVKLNRSVLAAESKIRQSELDVKTRNAGHYPTVNLNLSYMDRHSDDFQRKREDLVAQVELNVPLYQGGKTQAAIRQADARLNAEQARTEYIESEAYQQVRLAYSRMSSLNERLAALSESSESGQLYLDAAIRGHSLNLRTQVDVLDARTTLVDTQLRYAETLNQYLLANLRLHLETGTLTRDKVQAYDDLFRQAAVN
ncbi:TolC family outer membrane protein [Oceanospirillum sediminis]|uniref:TolC family outer membrane protein n=1 Tax=Oceanospirillum sediminis TaxID=2760088 RepID=A0A839ILV3_9GAMM|nr:TolC family outer membrane protein [Oceanospirillum sediminis]MBB1485306.1 TolC family outer membrane protein [Oceanospirillum sediminis]